MKARKFKIRIQPLSQSLDDFEGAFQGMSKKKGSKKPVKRDDELILGFESFELLSKILTPERLKLIKAVRESKPASVSELARLLGRAQANVHKDVHFLADLGILTLRSSSKRGSAGKPAARPSFDYDGFDIAV